MSSPIRVKIASKGLAAVMGIVAVASLSSLVFGVWSLSKSHRIPGVAGLAVGLALFGLNYVLKQKSGHDVEVTDDAIIEHRKNGPVKITWAEPHALEGVDLSKLEFGPSARGQVAKGMVVASKVQSSIVTTPDGRRIRVDTVFGSPVHEAIAAHSAQHRLSA